MMIESLQVTFHHLRRRRRKALIPFIMGGDPDLATTSQLLLALQDAGADVIEVGIPFSDPLADGPIIQAAAARALHRGATPLRVLEAIASVRDRCHVPVVCLSYWNPILQFGRFAQAPQPFLLAAQKYGVSGVIVPDLPVEEGERWRVASRRHGVSAVFLAAPTSPVQRLRMIARASEGFIYYVSVTGTTGVRHTLPASLVDGVRQLKLLTTKPVCVGFGISTPHQAAAVAAVADGVIVGSALVQRIAQTTGRQSALRAARTFVGQLRRAIHG